MDSDAKSPGKSAEAPPRPGAGARPAADTGAHALATVLRYFQIAADPQGLAHDHAGRAGRMDETALLRAGRLHGLRARALDIPFEKLGTAPLPCIVQAKDGAYFVLGRIVDRLAIVSIVGRPVGAMKLEDLEKHWSGRVLAFARRGDEAGARRFDLGWFVPAIARYRAVFRDILVASFFLQVFTLVTPLFFQVVIDKVLTHRSYTTLDVLAIGLVAIALFEAVLGGLRGYIYAHTANRIDIDLSTRAFRHLMQLPVGYFALRPVGQTVARVRELEAIRSFLAGSFMTLTVDAVFIVVFLAVMFHFSASLAWIAVAAIPAYGLLTLLVTPNLRAAAEDRSQRAAVNQAFLTESVAGIETVKSLAVEPQVRHRWEEQMAGYARSGFRVARWALVGTHGSTLIARLAAIALLWVGAQLVLAGDVTIGQLVAINMLATQINQPILRLAGLWQEYQQFRISVARLGEVMNAPSELPAVAGGGLPALKGALKFEQLGFKYQPDREDALADVTLDIPPGQVVGIVGPSGSGKSTLVKLVQRFYLPTRGRLLVDGADITVVDPAALRRQIGVVLQDNVLFSTSVRENIALARPAASLDEIVAAARLAGADGFIRALPNAYDTVIGERGSTLSGGQRQRIAIARALINDPRILILDEATSALDYESERLIQANLRAMSAGRTVLVVAHRLATVRRADRILVLAGGRVVEDGPHERLIAANGAYARLHRQQFGDEEE